MKSPIKYYGGKGLIANKILELFPEKYEIYIEPFGGGASVLFEKSISPVEIYNDINENVYSLFKILNDEEMYEKLRDKLQLTYYSDSLRISYIKILKRKDLSSLERAYYYFYVNRTSVNGMGGFSVSSTVRNNLSKSVSDYLSKIDGLEQLHKRLRTVTILNENALELITKWDRENVFFYIDPPYHPSVRTQHRYENDFTALQHDELIKILSELKKAKFLLSGYDCNEYKSLNRTFTKTDMMINTTGGNGQPKQKTESFWRNYNSSNLFKDSK